MGEQNLVNLFLEQADRYASKIALRYKYSGVYRDVTWRDFKSYVARLALSLRSLGIKKGDRVALLSENRPEWAYSDLAILSTGAIVVPIHATSSLREVEHILSHCDASALFISNSDQLNRISPILSNAPSVRHVVTFDRPVESHSKITSLEALLNGIRYDEPSTKAQYEQLVNKVSADDLATIIYTSGTTGPSKGVMLSHKNLLTNCRDAREVIPITDRDTSLSFLPLSHIFERMAGHYLSILCGATIAYAENMTTVPQNLLEVRPLVACAVPRFFEKLRAQILNQMDSLPKPIGSLSRWALRIGHACATRKLRGESISVLMAAQRAIAHKIVFSKIRKRLGGRLRFFVSGGAPLAREIGEFFYSIGIIILEGYGLTETSPVISVNHIDRFKFGSVGLPLRNVTVKIASDGEILAKGPSVMKGYYRDQPATDLAIQDGWFYTGDLGQMDSDGFLYIVGRKKDILVTSSGKNIAPQNIENALVADDAISQVMVVGDRHNYLTALVVPDFKQVASILALTGDVTPEQLVKNKTVHVLIRERIDQRMKGYASFESIKYFTLLAREFSQESDEMTLTLKIKRQNVNAHYREAIEKMYSSAEALAHDGGEKLFYVV